MKLNLEELKKLADAASEGPWDIVREEYDCGYFNYIGWNSKESFSCGEIANMNAKNNAAFIAASRTVVPQLIERIEELEKALEREECDCSSSTGELQTKCPDCICNRCKAL